MTDDENETTAAELSLWDAAFTEVVRQVSIHCQERGALLEAIRARHSYLFEYMLTKRESEISKLAQQHVTASNRHRRSGWCRARGARGAVLISARLR